MKLLDIIDKKKAKKDINGIWCSKMNLSSEVKVSHAAWKKIYNQNVRQLLEQKKDFNKTKLIDHLKYIKKSYIFSKKTYYLEIGCGPSYIGEYLMKKYDCYFIGIDFNYPMLLTLKKHFETMGYRKYLLIHANILDMPFKKNSFDYVYGGGVIEHLENTNQIMRELYRVLKKGGVSFNTVPAFNLWWLIRFWNNIPNAFILKRFFEFVHLTVLKGKILNMYYGYELSYTLNDLEKIHITTGFRNLVSGPFVFNPSIKKLKAYWLRLLYKTLTANNYCSPVYYIYGKK